jgi:hypothetical protein
MTLPTRLLITGVALIAALGIGSAPSGQPGRLAPILPAKAAAACGEAVSHAARSGAERARDGIARPWRDLWTDLRWAQLAGLAAFEEWRDSQG